MDRCPQCRERDAYESGGDDSLNVYDATKVTGIADPGDAWGAVNEAAAAGIHQVRREFGDAPTPDEARARLMSAEHGAEAEVAERLGDTTAIDYTEPRPEPIGEKTLEVAGDPVFGPLEGDPDAEDPDAEVDQVNNVDPSPSVAPVLGEQPIDTELSDSDTDSDSGHSDSDSVTKSDKSAGSASSRKRRT
jgi:hypothetical protein